MKIIHHTRTLPAHWASYLINNDNSGLRDGEQERIDAYLAEEGLTGCATDCGEAFYGYSDTEEGPGEVCKVSFLTRTTAKQQVV